MPGRNPIVTHQALPTNQHARDSDGISSAQSSAVTMSMYYVAQGGDLSSNLSKPRVCRQALGSRCPNLLMQFRKVSEISAFRSVHVRDTQTLGKLRLERSRFNGASAAFLANTTPGPGRDLAPVWHLRRSVANRRGKKVCQQPSRVHNLLRFTRTKFQDDDDFTEAGADICIWLF